MKRLFLHCVLCGMKKRQFDTNSGIELCFIINILKFKNSNSPAKIPTNLTSLHSDF